jgi:hypothetical protein
MAEILMDEQGSPATPGAGAVYLFPHNSSKRWAGRDSNGRILTLPPLTNATIASQALGTAVTYITNSNIAVPSHLLQVGTLFKWTVCVTKTAAGTAAPAWHVRVGTLGTTGDAAILTFTQVALQTAAVDTSRVEITAVVRSIGAAAVMSGGLVMNHVLAATGFSTLTTNVMSAVSAGFNSTTPNLIVGISATPGASAAWTVVQAHAEALGL